MKRFQVLTSPRGRNQVFWINSPLNFWSGFDPIFIQFRMFENISEVGYSIDFIGRIRINFPPIFGQRVPFSGLHFQTDLPGDLSRMSDSIDSLFSVTAKAAAAVTKSTMEFWFPEAQSSSLTHPLWLWVISGVRSAGQLARSIKHSLI